MTPIKHCSVHSSRRGFTLIEVMLALSIFTLAALAGLQVATEDLRSINMLEERAFALMVASNRLAELHVSESWPPVDGATGSMQLAEQTWYWRQGVVATVTDGLREVTVVVSATEGGNEAARLVSFVGRNE